MPHSNLKGSPRIPRMKPKEYMTVREAMRVLGCHEVTIRRWIQRGLLKVVRWRDRVLIREKDLLAWNRVRRYQRKSPRRKPVGMDAATLPSASKHRLAEVK